MSEESQHLLQLLQLEGMEDNDDLAAECNALAIKLLDAAAKLEGWSLIKQADGFWDGFALSSNQIASRSGPALSKCVPPSGGS